MEFIRKGNTILFIKKDKYENYDIFYNRINFIASTNPKNEDQMDKAILLSNIYINNKYMGCEYNQKLMQKVKEIINKSKKHI